MNLVCRIEKQAAPHPERPALHFEGVTTDYGTLMDQVARAAASLSALGIRRGDRVALFLPNLPAFTVLFLATVKIGAIAVPIHAKSTGEELQDLLLDSGAEILATTASLRAASFAAMQRDAQISQQIRHLLIAEGDAGDDLALQSLLETTAPMTASVDLPADAPAAILYTSGTTGKAKGATLSHGNIDFVMRSKVQCMGVNPEDRLLLFLPMTHCFGLNAVMNAALAGGACLIVHRRFELDEVLRSIGDNRATMFFGVPTTYILMLEKAMPSQLKPLRYFFCAADTLAREVEDRWRLRFGAAIHQGYGLTESSPFATYNHVNGPRPGSIGVAIPEVELAIADLRDGRLLPAGESGEILLRGPNVMLGYWRQPEETAACLRDGWLHTGDIGRIDAEGFVTIEERLKDMVIVGGANVYSAAVEQVLRQHPAVLEAGVFGRADAVLGERVCAAVVLRKEMQATAGELTGFCAGRLAEYKIPAEIEFVQELPKGPTGKVLKRVLREGRYKDIAQQTAHKPSCATVKSVNSSRELEDRIAAWLAESLGVEERLIARHASFSDYGVTSRMAVELAGRLCGWLGKSVPPTIAWQISTVSALARHFFPAEELQPVRKTEEMRWAEARHLDSIAHLADADAAALLREELKRVRWGGETA